MVVFENTMVMVTMVACTFRLVRHFVVTMATIICIYLEKMAGWVLPYHATTTHIRPAPASKPAQLVNTKTKTVRILARAALPNNIKIKLVSGLAVGGQSVQQGRNRT
jgi:Mg/Co/Ni transporter MgtE